MLLAGPHPPRARWRDFATVHPQRSMALLAAGALAGLLLAGYSLFTARGTSTFHVPAEDVALVNQQPIYRIDFEAQLQTLYGVDAGHATAEQRRRVLNDMIREELFVQRAKELDVASNDVDVRNAMIAAVEQGLAADAATSIPTDAGLRAFYDTHKEHYASEGVMTAQDLVFPAAQAAGALAALHAGIPPAAVLANFGGHDSHKLNGEEFYFAARLHLSAALFAAASALHDGGISDAIAAPDGVHVIVMVRNVPPAPQDFARAKDRVIADYRNEAIARLRLQEEVFLRRRANVLVAKDMQ